MNRNLVAIIVILLIIGVGGYLAYRSYKPASDTTPVISTPTTETTQTTNSPTPEATTEAQMAKTTVTVTASGFEPKTITIKAGDTVTWMNNDTKTHNVSSDPHPIHTTYTTLNLGNFMAGKTTTLTFPNKGTYQYHDHLFPSFTGTVVVE